MLQAHGSTFFNHHVEKVRSYEYFLEKGKQLEFQSVLEQAPQVEHFVQDSFFVRDSLVDNVHEPAMHHFVECSF